jgi:hypothetical protein
MGFLLDAMQLDAMQIPYALFSKTLSLSATIMFAVMAAHADDQADWLRSRQTEYAKWKALQQAVLPGGIGKDIGALTDVWDAPATAKMVLIPAGRHPRRIRCVCNLDGL